MKNNLLYFLAFVFLLSACRGDETPINTQVATFQYDGENSTAPLLETGEHILAARFSASATAAYVGQTLDRIEFFLQEVPAELELRVYGESATGSPGDLLWSADLSGDLRANSWNGHLISSPIAISGEDIWISIRVFHNSPTSSVGCDSGPANNNGDWILHDTANSWTSFRSFTNNDADINWNIRGFVD